MKNNNLTEIVFILDRSGSMSGFESDTIGGFNSTIQKQQELEGCAYVTTILFNSSHTMLHDRVPLDKIAPMTKKDYVVSGTTALYDAIGDTIQHINNIHKYARPDDVPAHTMFVITTDGMENASSQYSQMDIKEMIQKQENEYGWEFVFLAANIDAVETAQNIGIRKERAANFEQDTDGIGACYFIACESLSCLRTEESFDLNEISQRSILSEIARQNTTASTSSTPAADTPSPQPTQTTEKQEETSAHTKSRSGFFSLFKKR